VRVVGRLPIVVAPNQHSASYLEAKRLRMHHDLPEWLAASGDAE
jgi:GTP cyclohydrolase II